MITDTIAPTETTIEPPVSFTASALAEIHAIRERDKMGPDEYLRVGVKGGGCSGMSYILAFDAQTPDDQVFYVDGIRMIMDKRHALYLYNMEVDYADGLNARGFTFQNPNASSTCGCGTSFSV
jgi:iron-sulfur cluster assembly protein